MNFDPELIRKTEKECRKRNIVKANKTADAIEKMIETGAKSAKRELIKALLEK